MKRHVPDEPDLLALDQYERILSHHKELLKEAERVRQLKQIPKTGRPRPKLFATLLNEMGGILIDLGSRLQKWGEAGSPRNEFSLRYEDDKSGLS